MSSGETVVDAASAGEIEAIIAEARGRARLRRRRIILMALGLAAALATGVSAATGWFSPAPATRHAHGSPTLIARTSDVTGYIEPCAGAVLRLPPDPGGVVYALRGQLHLRRVAAGTWQVILPTKVVATDRIRTGQPFSFDLPPGRYVLLAQAGQGSGAFRSFLGVTVRRAARLHRDIPSGCK